MRKYERPKLEVINLEVVDVITVSVGDKDAILEGPWASIGINVEGGNDQNV